MKRIDSPSNTRIKELLRNLKRRQSIYLIEGKKLFEEAVKSGIEFQDVFVTSEYLKANESWGKGAEPTLVAPAVMKKISDVETSPGIAATAVRPRTAAVLTPIRFGALLLSIRDPGNLGTIIRTAEAAAADFIALSADSTDPYSAKVIRSSAGSIFRMPLFETPDAAAYLQQLRTRKISVYALTADAKQNLMDLKPKLPAVIVIGSESQGLPKDLPFENTVSIPMSGKVESLNAAVAASLAFYHFAHFQNT